MFNGLRKIQEKNQKNIVYIGGKGLVAALIFKKTKKINHLLKEVCTECMENGLLVVYTGRESIKIGPPLTISESALKEGVSVLDNSITKIFNEY